MSVESCVANPDALTAWAATAARFLSDMTREDDAVIANVALLLRAFLLASWLAPHQLAFALLGARSESADRWFPAFRSAVTGHWRVLRSALPSELAASALMAQVGGLSAEERQLALEVVLASEE